MKKKETVEEMERRDAAGYARIPSHASESEEWKNEPPWPDQDEGGTEFLASRNESLGFAHRTLVNLEYIEQTRKAGGDKAHVVTQRVVSLLGLIIFPWAEGLEVSKDKKDGHAFAGRLAQVEHSPRKHGDFGISRPSPS